MPVFQIFQNQEDTMRNYVLDLKQDVSIIFVDLPFEMNEFTAPACLPTQSPQLGKRCYVSGHGTMTDTPKEATDLMTASMKLINNDTVEPI